MSLDEPSSYLTTFNSPFGRYRFERLPFGLNLSQDVFQERMDHILERCPGTMGIADDVAVFGKDEKEHDANLHNLMKIAQQEGLVFIHDKCDIKKQKMRFFWPEFSCQRVNPDPEKITAISQLTHSLIWRPSRVADTPPLLPISRYGYCLFVADVCLCSEVLQPGSYWSSSGSGSM